MEERDKHFMLQTHQVLGSKIKPKLENYQFYMLEYIYKEQHKHEEEFSRPLLYKLIRYICFLW